MIFIFLFHSHEKSRFVCRGGLGHLYVAAAEWQHCPLRHGAMAGF